MREFFDILDWDSRFFGFTVATITKPFLDEEFLRKALKNLRRQGVTLAYWPATTMQDDILIADVGGLLVDVKKTFRLELANTMPPGEEEGIVSADNSHETKAAVRRLAVQAGRRSRFSTDERIPREKFRELYEIWAERSLAREIAFDVLIAKQNSDIAGMVTLGGRGRNGDIGLIAVDERHRGKKIGKKLVHTALNRFTAKGYREVRVVTQGDNISACHLYESCGFSLDKIAFFYHFWLV